MDQVLIIEYYKNQKNRNNIAKLYHLTESQIKSKFLKIDFKLYCFRKGKKILKFNFDAVSDAVNDFSFPYSEDKILMKKIFDLYYGQTSMETKSFQDIITLLNLNYGRTTLENKLLEFMISVCKYQEGIKNNKNKTLKELVENDVFQFLKSAEWKQLTSELREELLSFFEISERDLMSEEEKQLVQNLLNSFIENRKEETISSRRSK